MTKLLTDQELRTSKPESVQAAGKNESALLVTHHDNRYNERIFYKQSRAKIVNI